MLVRLGEKLKEGYGYILGGDSWADFRIVRDKVIERN